ncbi:extracellular solute-binding protein [Salinispora fenicalii]|uniref:extracellular solute-binding protein n=1 Tax=Salinispora fenicalii TaxID=1137263 RepID=UPI00048465BF|nr:extracellular solute-binding protein [Salinispora fenicalii]
MNRWKRLAPVTAVVASAALLLSGCGGSDAAADRSELVVWMMGEGSEAQTTFLDGVEAEFRQLHPETDVVVQYLPWLEAPKKFQAALAGGAGPDVTELGNTETQGWAAQGALANLTERFGAWDEGQDILPDLVRNAQLDGEQYGIPWYAGVRGIYYRTDWFAEAGVAEPPKTWADLVAAAKAVQAKKPDTYGIALPGNSELPFYSFLWAAGAQIATKEGDTWTSGYRTPAARQAVKFWTDLVTVHKVAPPAAAGWNEIDARTQFATGKAAMAFAGSWQQGAITKDNPEIEQVWGTFPIPGLDGEPAPVFAGGSDLALWEDSERKDLAWDYLTVLLSKKNDAAFAESLGFFPVYRDLVGGDRYTNDKIMTSFATAMRNTRLTPLTPKWVEISRTRTVTQAMNSSVIKGQKTVEEATADAAAEMESILNAR